MIFPTIEGRSFHSKTIWIYISSIILLFLLKPWSELLRGKHMDLPYVTQFDLRLKLILSNDISDLYFGLIRRLVKWRWLLRRFGWNMFKAFWTQISPIEIIWLAYTILISLIIDGKFDSLSFIYVLIARFGSLFDRFYELSQVLQIIPWILKLIRKNWWSLFRLLWFWFLSHFCDLFLIEGQSITWISKIYWLFRPHRVLLFVEPRLRISTLIEKRHFISSYFYHFIFFLFINY